MKAEWLATVDGREYGPYSWDELLQMAAEGRVPADLPVKRLRDSQWYKASQIPGLLPRLPPTAASAARPAAVAPAETRPPPTPPPPPARKKDDSQLKRARPLPSAAIKSASLSAPPAPTAPPVPPPPPPKAAMPPPTKEPVAAAGFPVIVTEGAAARGATPRNGASGEVAPPPRRRNSRLRMAGMAATALAAMLVVVAVIMNVWMRGFKTDVAAVAATAELQPSVTQISSPARREVARAALPEAERESAAGPTEAELAAQAETVASISDWQSVAGLKSFGVANASLQIVRVWRTSEGGAAADAKDSSAAGDFFCVEVAIRNQSKSPLKYRGWNSYGALGAILADEEGNVLPLVPLEETSQIKRMSAGNVPGNSTATEVLVFQAPASEGAVLHLVLPYGVFYSNVRPPHRAIELTPDLLGMELAGPPATAKRDEAASGGQAASGTATPKGIGKQDGLPPSIKEIVDSDPGFPVPPAEPPSVSDESPASGDKTGDPKKPENPFEPRPAEPPTTEAPAAKS